MPLSNFTRAILRRRHQRNLRNQRRIQLQRRRIINRIAPNNNALSQMAQQLPLQVTNDPFANQIFNGSSFC